MTIKQWKCPFLIELIESMWHVNFCSSEYANILSCMESSLAGAAKCTRNNILEATDFVRSLLGNTMEMICGDYLDGSDKCDKLGPPPKKLTEESQIVCHTGSRSYCVVSTILRILKLSSLFTLFTFTWILNTLDKNRDKEKGHSNTTYRMKKKYLYSFEWNSITCLLLTAFRSIE